MSKFDLRHNEEMITDTGGRWEEPTEIHHYYDEIVGQQKWNGEELKSVRGFMDQKSSLSSKEKTKRAKRTASRIPTWSPTVVLTGLEHA